MVSGASTVEATKKKINFKEVQLQNAFITSIVSKGMVTVTDFD